MKKINIATLVSVVISIAALTSCGGKQSTGRDYMPDMGKSRAFEAYAMHDTALFTTEGRKRGGNIIFYNSMPVLGTMKRGDLYPYALPNDSIGYKMSAAIKSPLTDTMNAEGLAEAGRLYNINCGICHGAKGAADGPVADKIGGVANLIQPAIAGLSDGTMFHVITYGKNKMGSYAAQLSKEERWQVIKYIRTLQNPKAGAAADSTAAKKAGADSIVVARKM